MLFYNIKRHCYVVVEVKVVEFEPGFISQIATYVLMPKDFKGILPTIEELEANLRKV